MEKFNVAIAVRDQDYADTISEIFDYVLKEIPDVSITLLSEKSLTTKHKNIALINSDFDYSNFLGEESFSSLDDNIWKVKKVYQADPRYVFSKKEKKLMPQIQYELIHNCRKIFDENKFDVLFSGGAAHLIWLIPHLVAMEKNMTAYKFNMYDYINPNFKGFRLWFCTDPFWDLDKNNNPSFDFPWNENEISKHIDSFRQSISTRESRLDSTAISLRKEFTTSGLFGILKNLLKMVLSNDDLGKRRILSLVESKKNKKYYTKINDLPDVFFVFPLNQPYDEQLLLRSPEYKDNFKNIELIANCLPKKVSLVVKEHPVNPGMFESSMIKNLTERFSSIKFVSPDLPLPDILNLSSGLITINSTAGLEAIIFGKPVLALGRGYYSKREVVFKPESKIAIKNDLLKMLENPNSEKSSLEMNKVLTKMMKQTYPGPNIFPPKDTIGGNTKKFMAEGIVEKINLIKNNQ